MIPTNDLHTLQNLPKGAKILFANVPADGHFNPLTGIAAHLKAQGYDVRWYTSNYYREKVERMGIPFYPLQKAMDFAGIPDPEALFPDRAKHKSQVAKLNFDLINVFIKRGPEYYADLKEIHRDFPFDLLIADLTFTGLPFVTDLMRIPAICVGIVPITKNSRDLPPSGLGLTPSYGFFGRIKQNVLRWVATNLLFSKSNKVMRQVLGEYGITTNAESVFDLVVSKCNLVLQTGTPGFEYRRSDLDPKYKFVGPLLPYTKQGTSTRWYNEKLARYKKVVLVTQGTVEKDSTKLLVPTLEALCNTDFLVVVTTGGGDTETLRRQYAAPNVIIEDYIPFADIMPLADVYVTNGGMGGVQLSIQNSLPMVTAGVHEGKNEICARVGYFRLGVNLKTERPTPAQIRKAVEEIVADKTYRKNVTALCKEFRRYNAPDLCERYVRQLLPAGAVLAIDRKAEEAVY